MMVSLFASVLSLVSLGKDRLRGGAAGAISRAPIQMVRPVWAAEVIDYALNGERNAQDEDQVWR